MMARDAFWRALGYIAFVVVVILTGALYFNDQENARQQRCVDARHDIRSAIVATVVYAFEQSPTEGADQVAQSQQFLKGLKELLEDIMPDSGCE